MPSLPMSATSAASSPTTGDDRLPLKAALDALQRRKWIILGTIVIAGVICFGLWFFVAPRYTASASVLADPREIRLYDTGTNAGAPPKTDDLFAENQLKVLGSRSTVEQAIESLGLVSDPEFNPALAKDPLSDVIEWVRQLRLDAGSHPVTTAESVREAVYQSVVDKLQLRREGQSNALTVGFTSTDPAKAARVANAIVDAYIKADVRTKRYMIERTQQSINQQLAQIQSQVEDADRAVERYRAAHQLTDTRNENLPAKQLSQLKSDLISARADRIAKEARAQEIATLLEKGRSYKPVTELASSPIIVELLQRQDEILRQKARLLSTYGEKHPLVLQAEAEEASIAKKLTNEVNNILGNFRSEAMVARAKERAITQAIDDAQQQFTTDSNASVQLHELERDALSKRSVYETTLVRLQQLKTEASVLQPDAQLISPAVPPNRPSFPRLSILVAVGSVASLVLGTLLAALREHLDSGLRSTRQVEAALGIPSLGLTPTVPSIRCAGTACKYVLDSPFSAYADAIKSIFMRLHWARSPSGPPQVLMITSATSGEGKTTLTMSLAALLARAGRKTIVVDLDLRNPEIGRLGERADMGWVDVLCGQRDLDDVIQSYGSEPNLDILPAGWRKSPSDLLQFATIRSIVRILRERYEFVLLDSPPVLGSSDANLAAVLPDAVLFVVQWQKTKEAVAATGLELLTRLNAPIFGAALTQVRIGRQDVYGYAEVAHYVRHGSHSSDDLRHPGT